MKQQAEALEQAGVRPYCKPVRTPAIGANFIPLTEQRSRATIESLP